MVSRSNVVLAYAGLAVIAIFAAGFVSAGTPAMNDPISVCYNTASGLLRFSPDGACRPGEAPLSLAAPAGAVCPAGTTSALGHCFETVTRAPLTHGLAVYDCALEGRRMASYSELFALLAGPYPVVSDGYEWSQDMDGGSWAWVAQETVVAQAPTSSSLPYRCVL